MKVLIIGGTGLISTAISRYLIERGENVTLFNRGMRKSQIPDGYKRIIGDRKDYQAFEAQMADAFRFDCVIDMICFLPEEAESAIRAFRRSIGHYIFCSTVDVYTKPAKDYPIREDAEREPSKSFPYAFNKALCENVLTEAHERGDFPVTFIRPACTYSDTSNPIHSFGGGSYYLDRLRKGKPIIVHGDGTSFWVACHRDDVGRAFANAVGNQKVYGKAYHVTGEEWMTWDCYHQRVAEAMGAPPPKLVHIPTDILGKILPKTSEWCVENFHFNNIFDNTAAHSDLGFKYTISWIDGVRRAIKWLDENGRIENSDDYPFYDRIIKAWEKFGVRMKEELADIDS